MVAMTNNLGNEFTHTDGIVYVAVDTVGTSCKGCAFSNIDCEEIDTPECYRSISSVSKGKNIIWRPKAVQ